MAREFSKSFYNSKEWAITRDYILKRDNYLCQDCKIRPAEEVHHIEHLTPQNINDVSVTMNPDNLVSLCHACHVRHHPGEQGKGRELQEKHPYEYVFDSNGMLVPK